MTNSYCPHICTFREFFLALKLAIQHIFQLAYGTPNMDTVIQQLVVTEPNMFKHFETFNEINIKIWKGQNFQIPSQLSGTFGHQTLSARSHILTQTGKKYLHFTNSIRQKVGMFLDNTTSLKKDTARKVLKFVTRSNPVNMLASFHALQCIFCTTDFESYAELASHFTECATKFEIRASGLEEQLSYTCERCDTEPMSYVNIVSHVHTFCIINFRATCPYCNSVNRICQCAKNKLDEANMLDNIRLNF